MARRRDYSAEYQRRKERLAAEGRTLYQQRNREAKRLGYDSLGDLRARRKGGDLTHADHANQAKKQGGRYVTNAGGGRWTFATDDHGREPLTAEDRARISATLNRAARANANVTITATWYDPTTGRRGTAQAGGDYGVRARRVGTDFESELRASVGSALPRGAIVTSVNIYAFPAGHAGEAA